MHNICMKATTIEITTHFLTISDSISVQISKSGWDGYYHVIRENGKTNSTYHRVMTTEQIKKNYDLDVS